MDTFSYNYKQIRSLVNDNAGEYHTLEFIFAELAKRMVERLDYIRLEPNVILDCGCGLGFDSELLSNKYSNSQLLLLDNSINLLNIIKQNNKQSLISKIFGLKKKVHPVNADAYNIPIKSQLVDFVYSNQLVPYLSDLVKFFKEVRRVTKVGGAFCVSGLGVDSFKELRELGLSTFRFPDMHDIGDMLIEVGFTNPVVDTEYITLEYDSLASLLKELKIVSCGVANDVSLRKYLGKNSWKIVQDKLNQPIKLTLEIFVAHGWKDRNVMDLPEGHNIINFSFKK